MYLILLNSGCYLQKLKCSRCQLQVVQIHFVRVKIRDYSSVRKIMISSNPLALEMPKECLLCIVSDWQPVFTF
jgi:hypothetical protein